MKKIDWFKEFIDILLSYSTGKEIWTSGDEILCKTKDIANITANLLAALYKNQGDEVIMKTGFYDPKEDERNGEMDRYSGWWYVDID